MDFGREDYNRYFAEVESPIASDEPVFMLRGLDPDAPAVMMDYCKSLMLQGSFDVAQSVFNHVKKFISYQKSMGTKHPDLVRVNDDVLQAQARIADVVTELEVSHSLSKSVYEQLLSDMEMAYGPDSLLTVLPTDYVPSSVNGRPYLTQEAQMKLSKCKLALVPNSGEWQIIKNEL